MTPQEPDYGHFFGDRLDRAVAEALSGSFLPVGLISLAYLVLPNADPLVGAIIGFTGFALASFYLRITRPAQAVDEPVDDDTPQSER